jgi:poly(3-hydroxybutyrate) depolymerase
MVTRRHTLLLIGLVAVVSARVVSGQTAIDQAFATFWEARNPAEAAAAIPGVIKSGVTFDAALGRLKRGRPYPVDAPRGVVQLANRTPAAEFPYTLDVPQSYDSSRPYQVRVQLHGGVGRPEGTVRGNGSIGSLAGADQIYVLPNAWADAMWWDDVQIANVRVILDTLKRTYNVDENRVVMSGVSDGATGTYYFAMRDPTPFASFLPLNGFMMILANPANGVDVQLFPHTLLNRPFFLVNGGRDPLYPTSIVDPYVRHLQKSGVALEYAPQPNGVHNTAWWPEVKDTFEAFARNHPRDPYQSKLTWEVGEDAPARRVHWLIVDRLSKVGSAKPALDDLNDFSAGTQTNFGVRVNGMRIVSVIPGSNAEKLGFRPGDAVVSINGRSLPTQLDLLEFLSIYNAGDALNFVVSRDNKPVTLAGEYAPRAMTRVVPLFPRQVPSGRVDLVRESNTVRVASRDVAEFTLLASPDAFDFGRPITVIADGRTVFNGRVQKSVETLMKWAAADNDRTMLFGAEIHVKVGD